MIRLSKSVLAVGGVVLAAGLIGVTNPKTVHALAAALVQVTNTASNPVVTQSTTLQAAQHVVLFCPSQEQDLHYQLSNYCTVTPLGFQNSPAIYYVPQGQRLVVTAIDIHDWNTDAQDEGQPCTSNAYYTIDDQATTESDGWVVLANTGSLQLRYPTGGLVFDPGSPVSWNAPTGACDANATIFGYLTAN